MRLVIASLVFLFIIMAANPFVGASRSPQPTLALADETPTPTPTPTPDPEIVKAQKEKALAEARKAKADADKAAADAEAAATAARLAAQRARLGLKVEDSVPTPSPPTGNLTTADGFKFIETQILADTSARAATLQLAEQICGSLNGRPTPSPTPIPIKALVAKPMEVLIINNGNDRSSVDKYRAILAQIKFLAEEYQRLINQAKERREDLPESAEAPEFAPALFIPAAIEVVNNAAALINLFRTEVELKEQAVNVTSRTVVSLLTNDLLNTTTNQCQVTSIFHPVIYPLSVSSNAQSGTLINAYRDLLMKISAGNDEVIKDNQKINELQKKTKELDKEIAELKKQIEAEEKKPAKKNGKKQKEPKGKAAKDPKEKESQEPKKTLVELKAELEGKEADKIVIAEKIDKVTEAVASIETFKTSLNDILKLLTAVDDTTKLPLLMALIRAERLSDLLNHPNTYVLDLDIKSAGTNRTTRRIIWNVRVDHSAGVSIDANLYNNEDKQVFATVQPFYIDFTNSKKIRERNGFKKLEELGH